MEFRNYRSSAQLVHCNIHQKRYSDVPVYVRHLWQLNSYKRWQHRLGILLKLSRLSLKQDSTPDPAPWSCKTMKTHIDRFDIHWRIHEIRGPAPLTAGFEASKLSVMV